MPDLQKAIWNQIDNNHVRYTNEIREEEGDTLAAITIDAWKTSDLEESGKVIADVLLSKHGDILVSYRDTLAFFDVMAQEKIQEAKAQLQELYQHRNLDNTVEPKCTKPKTQHVVMKFSPEQLALWNDCIGKTPKEIEDLFGALGENPELEFDFGNKYVGYITLRIPDEDKEKTDLVLDFFKRGEHLIKEQSVSDMISTAGDFLIETEHDGTFTMTIEEAPERKREGNTYIFNTQASDPELRSYNGQPCTILRSLEPKTDYDPLAINELMYVARFQDGFQEHVYDSELSEEPVKPKTASIDTIISEAQSRQETDHAEIGKEIEDKEITR